MDEEICGTCKFHISDGGRDWICDNEDSDCYGCSMMYRDGCEHHQERRRDVFRNKERREDNE